MAKKMDYDSEKELSLLRNRIKLLKYEENLYEKKIEETRNKQEHLKNVKEQVE
jgi:hypothetical protein